jgi:hypothetical protein
MHPATRSALEAGALFCPLVLVATALFYSAGAGVGTSVWASLAMGAVAAVSAFLAVLLVIRSRLPEKRPVFGAGRGAGIGILVVAVAAAVHAIFTFGSAGLLYSALGQVAYACLVVGGSAALLGALLGRSAERRLFKPRAG